MSETLVQVRAYGPKPFTAGLIVVEDRCTEAAPILRKSCLGKSSQQLRKLFKGQGWKAVIVR